MYINFRNPYILSFMVVSYNFMVLLWTVIILYDSLEGVKCYLSVEIVVIL